jgi:hypothetical protein
VLQQTSTVSSAEAAAKRTLARAAGAGAGYETLVATRPAGVRWLLCGRGRPVSTSSSNADYTVVLTGNADLVLFPDIEESRVTAEERFEELGYEPVPFPWHEGPQGMLAELVGGRAMLTGDSLEEILSPLRLELGAEERERYRAANDNAHRYAAWLESTFVEPRRIPEMLAELRRFYRQGLAGKLATIASAA